MGISSSSTKEYTTTNYDRRTLILIVASFLLKLVVAASLELGNDESYYWLYAQQLQWNYFDHPPLVAIWVRISTLNGLLPDSEWILRMAGLLSSSAAAWFLYRAVTLLKDSFSGWIAVCLFTASLYTTVICGILIMPDAPQLFFWTFALWQLARILKNDRNVWSWVLFGISAGLCIMSKIHGLFLPFGLLLFAIIHRRKWLLNYRFYLANFLVLVIISPVVIWNLQHHLVTWQFHSARVLTDSSNDVDSFGMELLQQIVITNPVCFVVIITSLVVAFPSRMNDTLIAYRYIALPFVLIVICLALFRDVWFHWNGPAFVTLIPQAASWLSASIKKNRYRFFTRSALALIGVFLITWPLVVHYYPGTYGSKKEDDVGAGDVTLDKYGWKTGGKEFVKRYNDPLQLQELKGKPIVCFSWWGAHYEYYFAKPAKLPMIGIGNVYELHQYSWLNRKRLPGVQLDSVITIESSIEKTTDRYRQYFQKNKVLFRIPVIRGNKQVAYFTIRKLWDRKS